MTPVDLSSGSGEGLAGRTAPLVDAHAHTWSKEFKRDHAATMARAWSAGLAAVVEVGVDSETGLQALALARDDERVHAVAGLHPHEAKRLPAERDALRRLLDGGGFVALGEIGLDFYRNLSPPEAQYEALRWQLNLARELALPVVVHSRSADQECVAEIEAWAKRCGRYLGPDREVGMMHCFAGDAHLGARYVELGFLVSIPGTVTYQDNVRGQEVVRRLPLSSLLVETDCPYLTPRPHRGARNEPAYVVHTARAVAELRGCTFEQVAQATSANASRLFGFPLP